MTPAQYMRALERRWQATQRLIKKLYGDQPRGQDLLEWRAVTLNEQTEITRRYHAQKQEKKK